MGQLIPHQFGALLAGVEHRSVSYVRLRLWLENKRLSDESIFLPIQPEILGQDVICQKFSEWEIQFRFRGPLLQHPPSPIQCKADISNVVAILQRGIALAISLFRLNNGAK